MLQNMASNMGAMMGGGGMGGGGMGGGGMGGGSRRLQMGGWGRGWGGSQCPLLGAPVDPETDDTAAHETMLDGLVPWMQSEIETCGCANILKYLEPNLAAAGCMCEPKFTNCTTYKTLMTTDSDLGKHATVMALPILVEQLGGMSWGGRRLTEDEAAVEDLLSRTAENVAAKFTAHQEKEGQILEMIRKAKAEKAAEEARLLGEDGSLRGRVRSAFSDLFAAVETEKQPRRFRRTPTDFRFLSEEEEVKCSDFNRDPCGCAAQENCEYDHQACLIEQSSGRPEPGVQPQGELGECKDQSDAAGNPFAAIFGRGRHAALTSCMECPSKDGCAVGELWDRLGPSLEGLKPKVKIFDSREDIEAAVLMEGYEWGNVEVGSIQKGDTPICGALHFGEASGSSVDVNIQLNASALGRDLNLLDQTYKWTQSSRLQRFTGYLSGGASTYTAMQKFIENFALEKAGHEDVKTGNLTEPYFVPFATDSTSRFGVAVWFPEQIPGCTTNFHRGAWIISICFASTVFRERVTYIRDGLQMMGLSDKGYYASVFAFFKLWILIPTLISAAYFYNPIFLSRGDSGINGTLFPGSNFVYIWYIMFCEMYTVFLMCLILGCVTDRRPVMFMLTFVLLDVQTFLPDQVIS